MPDCSHNLTSLGKLARSEGISTVLAAGLSPSYLVHTSGWRSPLLNCGVIVIPPASMDVGAFGAVTRGALSTRELDGKIVHARGNHSQARTLRQWHRCTSNVPTAWTARVRDEPCDDCLEAVSRALPSDKHAPKCGV